MDVVREANAEKPATGKRTRKQSWEYGEAEERIGERMLLGLPSEPLPQKKDY